MPSPFPGMDPYLESHWGDIHHRLITYACDQLQARLPPDLRARIEEVIYVELPNGREQSRIPDLRVVEGGRKKKKPAKASGAKTSKPLVVALDDPVTEGYIEIRDARSGMRVVTVIEVLSQTNKIPGEGQEQYLQKRRELRQGRVSLVEIDLIRSGKRQLLFPPQRLPEEYRTPYLICVHRGWHLAEVEVYRVPLREPLPTIKIPLRQTDADVPLELQPLIEQCYRNGGYEDDIDYRLDPEPPLQKADARWADTLLRQAGVRGRRSRRGQT